MERAITQSEPERKRKRKREKRITNKQTYDSHDRGTGSKKTNAVAELTNAIKPNTRETTGNISGKGGKKTETGSSWLRGACRQGMGRKGDKGDRVSGKGGRPLQNGASIWDRPKVPAAREPQVGTPALTLELLLFTASSASRCPDFRSGGTCTPRFLYHASPWLGAICRPVESNSPVLLGFRTSARGVRVGHWIE